MRRKDDTRKTNLLIVSTLNIMSVIRGNRSRDITNTLITFNQYT